MEEVREGSILVIVIAWIFIIFSGFAVVISLMQNLIMYMLFPIDDMSRIIVTSVEEMPDYLRFIFTHMRIMLFIFFALSLAAFVSSIGLLLKKKWGRIIFIIILITGIVWLIVSSILLHYFIAAVPDFPNRALASDMEMALKSFQILMAVMSVTIGVFFLWVIKKLITSPIREEFEKIGRRNLSP